MGTTFSYAAVMRFCDLCSSRSAVNLEFNAHFLDTALSHGLDVVECPITFHPRVGVSKGGNVNNGRALRVGVRMPSE